MSNRTLPNSRPSLLNYLASELTRGYLLERDEAKYSEKRNRVYSFMRIPRALERFLIYGFFQCVDAFLFMFTFLPLRILLAFIRLVTHPCGMLQYGSSKILEQAQICDLLKGVIILAVSVILHYIDTSMLYHIIRGQAVIKLYIFYNMLELADKLFCTFGQDSLDALFWTATEPRHKGREHIGVIPHLIIAIIYVFLHTMLFLFQVTTLSVAFNSHNKALLTIMMSNNFVEIKSSVFRRIDKNQLFHITCSDARERFHYVLLLCLLFMRNMTEFSWDPEHFWLLLPDAVLVLVAEVLVDWFKHAFITKFNDTQSEVYHDFTVSIAYDMMTSRQKYAFIDHSDLVSRRMTFTPLPLVCLVTRMCSKSIRITGLTGIAICIIAYLCFVTLKILTSIILLGRACDLIKEHKRTMSSKANTERSMKTDTDHTENVDVRDEFVPAQPMMKHKRTASSPELPIKRFVNVTPDSNLKHSQKETEIFSVESQPALNSGAILSNSSVSINSLGIREELQHVNKSFTRISESSDLFPGERTPPLSTINDPVRPDIFPKSFSDLVINTATDVSEMYSDRHKLPDVLSAECDSVSSTESIDYDISDADEDRLRTPTKTVIHRLVKRSTKDSPSSDLSHS